MIINVSRYRCDALAVTPEGIRLIPLPKLDFDQAVQHTERYLNAMSQLVHDDLPTDSGATTLILTARLTLEWLWDTVTHPILDVFGYTCVPDELWPRVWWCPTGPLTLVPLHAAGYHFSDGTPTTDEPATVLDRVVSSYTPTLRTLIRARRESTLPTKLRKLLIVALTQPPSYAPEMAALPGAREEAQLLANRLPGQHTSYFDAAATCDNVLDQLSTHAYVHFACHGEQDLYRPSQGALYLHDAPLRVSHISHRELPQAELAFLSACQSGIGGVLHLDEAIHLAAALQIVGYRHIIATLWSIADRPAPQVADQIWATLTEHGQINSANAAWAVHKAVRNFRDLKPNKPYLWAPYLHTGP